MNLRSFPFGSAAAQAAALRRGQVGSVELLRAYLQRIDRFNPALNASALGLASFLPSTVAPVGLTPEGLPLGLQIVAPEFADRSTIWLADQLGGLIGGCSPPPGY